jgi:hypothetical protein
MNARTGLLQAIYAILGVAILILSARWLLDVGFPRPNGAPAAPA